MTRMPRFKDAAVMDGRQETHNSHSGAARALDEKIDNLTRVKHVLLVLSGKGGVGKSTISVQLALALHHAGNKVGILDIDLCGPSIPKMLNVHSQEVHQCPEGWVPVFVDPDQRLGIMSIAFLLKSETDAVVWRGPKKTAMIKQFISDVYWQDMDYLIIDTPPGTSDEHIAVMENLRHYSPDGAILVTTPQAVAVGDVRRELTFCKKTGISVLGIIENMSGYVCPHCTQCTNIFSKGGGESLATMASVPFLGCVPLDPQLTASLESGQNFFVMFPTSPARKSIESIMDRVIEITNPIKADSG